MTKFTCTLAIVATVVTGISGKAVAQQSSKADTLFLSFGAGGHTNLKDGTWIESQSDCRLQVIMEDNQVSSIKVTATDPSTGIVNLRTNRPFNTVNNRVTTVWDPVKGIEEIEVRIPAKVLNPSVNMPIVNGPITSDEKFFTEVLNLDYPGLEAVKTAVVAKDFLAARTAFVKHLKTRKSPNWFFDWRGFDQDSSRVKDFDTSAADKVVNGLLVSCSVPYQYGDHINWSINPTELKYVEWTWQLSRHPFWVTLGKAYWATGDEKYAKAFVKQLRGWIIDNPLPNYAANDQYSRWRTIESGIRASNAWPESFFRFLGSPSFDDESILMMVKSFYEHGVHLAAYPSRNNWLTMEMNGLYKIAVLFPEFKQSSAWEKTSSETLYEEEQIQVYPDGSQVELAPGYHGVSLNNILAPFLLARVNGKQLHGNYVKGLEGMYNFYLNICSPSGKAPALNDSGWSDCLGPLEKGYSYFPERTDFQYITTSGAEGRRPSFNSVWMPWAGWYTMRSGWDKDALYSHFEVGPYSGGHSHEDKLSLVMEAYGNRILTEGGTYPYDVSQWRKYVLSARAHNLVRVDGMDQNRAAQARKDFIRYSRKPMSNRWISNSKFDFGEGWYDEGFGPRSDSTVTQYRALLFLKDRGWLMFDVFTPSDDANHTYETSFHLDAPEALVDPKLKSVTGKREGSAVLSIVPLREGIDVNVVTGQEVPEVQGWVKDEQCGAYGCRPIATPIFKRVVSGQWVEPYLLWPLKAGEESPVAEVVSTGPDSVSVNFKDGAVLSVRLKTAGNSLSKLSWTYKPASGKSVSAKVLK